MRILIEKEMKRMEYKVKVVYKEKEVSDSEKKDRLKQFQQAFVTAAVSYYSDKKTNVSEKTND